MQTKMFLLNKDKHFAIGLNRKLIVGLLTSDITAELSIALAVVKVTLQDNDNSPFWGSAPSPKNYWGDKDKIWHRGGEPTCKIW